MLFDSRADLGRRVVTAGTMAYTALVSAMRANEAAGVADVAAVVLETDGSLGILGGGPAEAGWTTLAGVRARAGA